MPFFRAKRSHLVSCFCAGKGFSRGKGVVGTGRVSSTPSIGCDLMGHAVRSWLMRACAQSREMAAMSAEEGDGGTGLESLQSRLPRSNVYGMGLSTMTGLVEGVSQVLWKCRKLGHLQVF